MPSVIPARLQFQCGHAALVTLPRVKGETATQRNDRVMREKTAALSRQCDFCAPVNGAAHVEVADAVETSPVEELAVIVSAPPEPTAPEPVVLETPVAAVEEVSHVETNGVVAHAEHVETNGVAVAAAKPARKPRVRRQVAQPVASGRQFLVEYRLERVVRADSIRDALRQVAVFGPAEVVAINRED